MLGADPQLNQVLLGLDGPVMTIPTSAPRASWGFVGDGGELDLAKSCPNRQSLFSRRLLSVS